MSIYTQAEFDSLKTAIVKLMSGAKTVQVSIGGKFIRYQDIQLKQAKVLLNEMALDLGKVVPRAYAKQKGRFF